jgi:hypothetical protein
MKFKFVDKLEKDIADFLYDYNHKGWALRNSPVAISFKLPEDMLTDDRNELWDYGERPPRINSLRKRLENDWKRCEHIAVKDPLLIDKAEDQIDRIKDLALILHRLENNEQYTKWDEEKITKKVDLDYLPHVSRVIKGYTVDSIIQEAETWADEGNHGEEGAAAFSLRLLMDELGMTRGQSVEILKANGNRLFKKLETKGSMENKYKALQKQFKSHYPEKYRNKK